MEELIRKHYGYVVKLSCRFSSDYDERQDLLQEGFMGLLQAAEKFDPTKGVKFLSFATPWIEGRMKNFLTRQIKAKGITGKHDRLRKSPPVFCREENNSQSEYSEASRLVERDPLRTEERRELLGKVLVSDFTETLGKRDRDFFYRRYRDGQSLSSLGTKYYYRIPAAKRYKEMKHREQNIKRWLFKFALSRPEIQEYKCVA